MQLDSRALSTLVPRPAEVWGVISRGFPVWTLPKAATQGPVACPEISRTNVAPPSSCLSGPGAVGWSTWAGGSMDPGGHPERLVGGDRAEDADGRTRGIWGGVFCFSRYRPSVLSKPSVSRLRGGIC